jgi:hypothetical protein
MRRESMKRTRGVLKPAVLVLFISSFSICQTPSPVKTGSKPKLDPCESTQKKPDEEAWGKGFTAGMEIEQLLYSIKVGDTAQAQKISIVVGDIDGSTSYEFAAAEVIRTYFADFLTVVPSSDLTLHISGTKSMPLSYGDVQSIEVEVTAHANQLVLVGDDKRLLYGSLQLASDGGTMKGYSLQEKTQAVREYLYKALSEYKDKWEKAKPKQGAPS